MAGPVIDKELQATLRKAFDHAGLMRHEYVTLEHLLLALTEDPKASKALRACGADLRRLRKQLDEFMRERLSRVPENVTVEPRQTLAVERVLQRAAIHAISSEMKTIDGGNVLVQILKEEESYAAFVLQEEGVSPLDLKRYIAHGVGTDIVPGENDSYTDTEFEDDQEDSAAGRDPLEAFATDLIAEAAEGRIDPLIGRDAEVDRTVQVLCRRREEQSGVRRRGGRRQDRHRGRPGAPNRGRTRTRSSHGRSDLFPRYGRTARRHQVSRPVRAAFQGDHERSPGAGEFDSVHRRDPHDRRRRRNDRRLDGRVEHSQAGARVRENQVHRVHDLCGLQTSRPRSRSGPQVSEDRGP